MRRTVRLGGALLIAAGLGLLAWSFAVWRWEDPFTGAYTSWEQRRLGEDVERRFEAFAPRARATSVTSRMLAAQSRRYRRGTPIGAAIGRIDVPRLDLSMVLVYGTDTESLKRGPGLDPRTSFPGQGQLVYVAGHRTTYAAPFSRIDSLRRGDVVRLELPYGTFTYRVTGSRIVDAHDLSVLRSKGYEQLALQACHPRFFATHRWISYARLADVAPPERARSGSAAG